MDQEVPMEAIEEKLDGIREAQVVEAEKVTGPTEEEIAESFFCNMCHFDISAYCFWLPLPMGPNQMMMAKCPPMRCPNCQKNPLHQENVVRSSGKILTPDMARGPVNLTRIK